ATPEVKSPCACRFGTARSTESSFCVLANMIGQGRPSWPVAALARAMLTLCACFAILAARTSAQQAAPPEPIRLLVSWGGGEATRWTGVIGLDQGKISD